ncbi:MAG: hypothetical protein JXA91_07475 [Candidatus Thermoplasmatota archaeon]|nr:hypothetical protein [Candidatus Thermoplasmatota archaeon]
MKRKIIGIFIIALLTISYMPIITSEASQVPESNESKGGDIKIFFIGGTNGTGMIIRDNASLFLVIFGIYNNMPWVRIDLTKNYILLVDGKIKNFEPPCELRLYNFTGIGTPWNVLWIILKIYTFSWKLKMMLTLIGNCESYEIQNETRITT